MNVMYMQPVLSGKKTEFIGCPNRLASLDATSGHPHREPGWIVVSTISLFAHGRAAELAAPNHEGLVEHAALFQVGNQANYGMINLLAEL